MEILSFLKEVSCVFEKVSNSGGMFSFGKKSNFMPIALVFEQMSEFFFSTVIKSCTENFQIK